MGLARMGSYAGNGSGDIFMAFSTANAEALQERCRAAGELYRHRPYRRLVRGHRAGDRGSDRQRDGRRARHAGRWTGTTPRPFRMRSWSSCSSIRALVPEAEVLLDRHLHEGGTSAFDFKSAKSLGPRLRGDDDRISVTEHRHSGLQVAVIPGQIALHPVAQIARHGQAVMLARIDHQLRSARPSERSAWYICSAPRQGTLKSARAHWNSVGVLIRSACRNG